jgi:hypothetical protein
LEYGFGKLVKIAITFCATFVLFVSSEAQAQRRLRPPDSLRCNDNLRFANVALAAPNAVPFSERRANDKP